MKQYESLSAKPNSGNGMIIECNIKRVVLWEIQSGARHRNSHRTREDHGLHWTVRMWEKHRTALPNRMNDLVRSFRFEGHVHSQGRDIYEPRIDPVAVRRHIGMVFQQPNPFAMSIYRNVAFGLRLNGYRGNREGRVEQALRKAALWDEVKDKLHSSGLSLCGGQQQRLCIARAIATEPQVLLMDEPCSALDPIATRRIEELMLELKQS